MWGGIITVSLRDKWCIAIAIDPDEVGQWTHNGLFFSRLDRYVQRIVKMCSFCFREGYFRTLQGLHLSGRGDVLSAGLLSQKLTRASELYTRGIMLRKRRSEARVRNVWQIERIAATFARDDDLLKSRWFDNVDHLLASMSFDNHIGITILLFIQIRYTVND
jgi:hypothetical protein